MKAPESYAEFLGSCSICNWTNVSLINLGEPNKPRMVCQGCCKRAVEAMDAVLALTQNASLDRPAASAGTVGGVVGLLPVGLIPIPPMILQEANRRAMENGDLTFGHGFALVLALCATWGLCAVAIWIKRAIVRRFHKANDQAQILSEANHIKVQ